MYSAIAADGPVATRARRFQRSGQSQTRLALGYGTGQFWVPVCRATDHRPVQNDSFVTDNPGFCDLASPNSAQRERRLAPTYGGDYRLYWRAIDY